MTGNLDGFLKDVEKALGAEWVNRTGETLHRYGEHTLPGANRPPAAVVYPGSTADVQAVVRAANAHKTPLFPISTGNNMGLGTRAPVHAGEIVVDLGRRMNRIVEIDEQLAFASVEPGVSFQAMADELQRRGGKFMISTTSGPPQGGMLGNAMDKGAGYGPPSTISALPAAWRSCWETARCCAPATARSTIPTSPTGTSRNTASGRSSTACSPNRISASSRASASGSCRGRRRSARSISASPTTTISRRSPSSAGR